MLCDNCNKNEANFHSIKNINGKVTEKHLCSECAKEDVEFSKNSKNFFNDFEKDFGQINFFDDFMSDFNSSFSYFDNPFFSNILDFENNFFDNSFKSNKIGNNLENKTVQVEEIKKNLTENDKKQLEIKKLDIELKKAVVEERYEDAIVLRDKIKKLKEEKIN